MHLHGIVKWCFVGIFWATEFWPVYASKLCSLRLACNIVRLVDGSHTKAASTVHHVLTCIMKRILLLQTGMQFSPYVLWLPYQGSFSKKIAFWPALSGELYFVLISVRSFGYRLDGNSLAIVLRSEIRPVNSSSHFCCSQTSSMKLYARLSKSQSDS